MTLGRLFKILWGRKLIVLAPSAGTLIGGLIVILTFPPRYEATTRVILDIMKPDPVTGFQVPDKNYDAYIASEINMLRTEEVTGRVVEAMGWLDNPDMVAAWRSAPDKGDDLRRWAGRRVGYGIGADMVPQTNIMEISFQSTAPDLARLVAENVRTSFIEASVAQTRDTARATATNLSAQAERERERLINLQVMKANLERETGIIMNDGGITEDDLRALAAARATPSLMGEKHTTTSTRDDSKLLAAQLQNIDSAIVASGQTLGPNNPVMMEMHRRRDFVAAQLSGAKPADPVENMTMRRLQAVTALAHQSSDRISSVSDKRLALRIIQDEIKRRRLLFDRVATRSGQQMEISNVSDANLTPLGATVVKPAPVFPNLALILGGCGLLGLASGALLAFIVEALGRRVRGAEDLLTVDSPPLLGVLPAISWPKERRAKVAKVRPPKPERQPKAARSKGKLARA